MVGISGQSGTGDIPIHLLLSALSIEDTGRTDENPEVYGGAQR